jgi:hypothetical protein
MSPLCHCTFVKTIYALNVKIDYKIHHIKMLNIEAYIVIITKLIDILVIRKPNLKCRIMLLRVRKRMKKKKIKITTKY